MDDCSDRPNIPRIQIRGKGALGVVPGSGTNPETVVPSSKKPTIGDPVTGVKTLVSVVGFGKVRPRLRGTDPETPVLGVPVQNTTPYTEVFANNLVEVIEFANQMESEALTLASNLQALANSALVDSTGEGLGGGSGGGGGGGGVSEGVGNSCKEDFNPKANNFVVNCNSYTVDDCGTPPPVNFNCGSFTITLDSTAETFTVTDGTSTISLNNGTLTFTGFTTLDLPAITTIDGNAIATEAYADAAAASAQSAAEAYADAAAASAAATLPSHRHQVELDANTATTEYTGYAGT